MRSTKARYIIGIDPGTKTGIAIWDRGQRKLKRVETMKLHQALWFVWNFCYTMNLSAQSKGEGIMIRCENPNTWKPHKYNGHKNTSKLQGAGSIKRDFAIWKEFAQDNQIEFESVNLTGAKKKITQAEITMLTGWNQRTSEHARDAAMLVFEY